MEKKNPETTKEKLLRFSPLLLSPLITALMLMYVFRTRQFYPFGERTVAWCDMNQQVVPLLCQLKDILDGKSGWFLSFKNASGMNFVGVFFFFLSSPFSFLVKFVEKHDMLLFANILVMLKMMTSAVTASLYFVRSEEHRSLDPLSVSLLGFMYASSGYVMLFYQNVIWLDVMYVFPLLMISLERLHKKHKPLMYILLMALVMVINYYIGYMVVLFVLLTAGIYSVMGIKADNGASAETCLQFLVGSAAAALLSACVWLPSFMQYMTSGRRTSLLDNLRTGDLVTDYDTVLTVIFGAAAMLILAAADIYESRKDCTPSHKLWKIMALLLTVPLFLEPVNKMWHTGSYMAFPARYAFMTVFMLLIMSAHTMSIDVKFCGSLKKYGIGGVICAFAVFVFGKTLSAFIEQQADVLSEYTRSLGGSEASFKALLRVVIVSLIFALVIRFFYRKGWVIKSVSLVFLSVITVIQAAGMSRIYMTSSGEKSEDTYALQRKVLDLSDHIDDDSFYRVKTSAKIFDYNMIGAMGYNSIGHYTSLTKEDYMFTMKRLGYTSVWMEIGTCGGTALTDSLLSVGYEIGHDRPENTVYNFDAYNIYPLSDKLPLGIVTETLPDEEEIPAQLTRTEVQRYTAEALFGNSDMISIYAPDEGELHIKDGNFTVADGETLIYRVRVGKKQSLYFDCFDRLSNELSEPDYDSFSVAVNGKSICRSYPFSKENGVLKLGTFENEIAIIEIHALKDVSVPSYGVFGIDREKLSQAVSGVKTLGLTEMKNGLKGSCDLDKPSTILLSVPYDSGFTLKVNGREQPINKSMSCFMSFELDAGHSDIEISFVPTGFKAGAVLSIIGAAVIAAYAVYLSRRKEPEQPTSAAMVSRYLVAGAAILVFIAVYILPLIINILFWKKEVK